MPVTFFHIRNSYMVSWQEEGETSRAKDLFERSTWQQQPCPHSDPACRSPAEPHWPNPTGSRGQERRDGAVGTGQLPMTKSIVKKGREWIWRVKGRWPEPCDNIPLLEWKTGKIAFLIYLGAEGGAKPRRNWRPLQSTKMTPMRSSIESLVQGGKIKDGARK